MKKMLTKWVIIFIFVSVANGIEDVQPNPPSLTTATSIVITTETNSRLVRMEPKIDYQTEYEQFRKKLAYMNEIRSQNMIHLENYYRSLMMLVMEQNNTNDSTAAQLADLTFRVYDSETGIQFEDEFDCDLNLLADCESSLLRKIEIIDGRRVVFTMNRTEEEEVSSQIDMLNVCRSMDKEFTCLINYADKCEKKMNWSTFSILKYIITQNNETIVSCKQKEIDWLGPPKIQEAKYLTEEGQGGEIDKAEEWIDQNGMGHHLSHQPRGPCIPWTNVSQCWMTNMGIDFGEFGRTKISETDQQQCQSGYHFERCLKKYLYEVDSLCSLDEKEVSLQTILGSIQWELTENRKQRVPNICSELRQRWLQEQRHPMIGIQETIYQDKWDRSKRFAFDLRHDFGSLLDPYCDHVVKKFDKPCQNRFERRLRGLWWQEDHQGEQLDPVIEKETICCSISEFKQCVSIYVLIRCGKDSFRYFNNRAKIAQLDQCSGVIYGTPICQTRLNIQF